MPIRLHVKNQPPKTVTKYDYSKPIDQVGAELVTKAVEAAKPPQMPEVVAPPVVETVPAEVPAEAPAEVAVAAEEAPAEEAKPKKAKK